MTKTFSGVSGLTTALPHGPMLATVLDETGTALEGFKDLPGKVETRYTDAVQGIEWLGVTIDGLEKSQVGSVVMHDLPLGDNDKFYDPDSGQTLVPGTSFLGLPMSSEPATPEEVKAAVEDKAIDPGDQLRTAVGVVSFQSTVPRNAPLYATVLDSAGQAHPTLRDLQTVVEMYTQTDLLRTWLMARAEGLPNDYQGAIVFHDTAIGVAPDFSGLPGIFYVPADIHFEGPTSDDVAKTLDEGGIGVLSPDRNPFDDELSFEYWDWECRDTIRKLRDASRQRAYDVDDQEFESNYKQLQEYFELCKKMIVDLGGTSVSYSIGDVVGMEPPWPGTQPVSFFNWP